MLHSNDKYLLFELFLTDIQGDIGDTGALGVECNQLHKVGRLV